MGSREAPLRVSKICNKNGCIISIGNDFQLDNFTRPREKGSWQKNRQTTLRLRVPYLQKNGTPIWPPCWPSIYSNMPKYTTVKISLTLSYNSMTTHRQSLYVGKNIKGKMYVHLIKLTKEVLENIILSFYENYISEYIVVTQPMSYPVQNEICL